MLKIEILMQWVVGGALLFLGGLMGVSGCCVVAVAMAYPKLFAAMLCGQIVANHVTPAPGWQMPVGIYTFIYINIYYRGYWGLSVGQRPRISLRSHCRALLSFHFA